MSEVLFSFVVPVYDRTQKLRESIRSLLRQTLPDFEIILVCDGSPEPTLEVVDELAASDKVRVFHYASNSGNACRGRNRGIREARGQFVCFHDSDDIAHHKRLERTAAVIERGDVDGVYGPSKVIMDGTREIDGIVNGQVLDPPEFDISYLYRNNMMMTCSVTVRRESLLRFGGFRPQMRYREDHELWLRLAHRGCRWARSPELLCYYRIHGGNAELVLRDDDQYWYDQVMFWYDKPYAEMS
jgi:O-antigen biosynthesis protein